MNQLSQEKQILIANLLVEGNSIRSIERITGVHRDTIMRLGITLGNKAYEFLEFKMRNLNCKYIQLDEMWGFIKKKKANKTAEDKREYGDVWVWVALDADTKLVPFFSVGKRSQARAVEMMEELQSRINNRFQLCTDSFRGYFNAVDAVFGEDIDYAQLHKVYGEPAGETKRYSPANIIRVTKKAMLGHPDVNRISTSYVERQNLTMRMQIRRLTRLTNAFSKKLYNFQCAIALHFFHYNFMRIHQSLRVTPAMEAGITTHLWTWYDFLNYESQISKVA